MKKLIVKSHGFPHVKQPFHMRKAVMFVLRNMFMKVESGKDKPPMRG